MPGRTTCLWAVLGLTTLLWQAERRCLQAEAVSAPAPATSAGARRPAAFVPLAGAPFSAASRPAGCSDAPQWGGHSARVAQEQRQQGGARRRGGRMRLTMQSQDYYEILGVSRSATKQVRGNAQTDNLPES